MSEIIVSKILQPFAAARLIERPRLVGMLTQTEERQIIILTAPAGYGKTALMVQMAGTSQKPSVWYQLDQYDNDPMVFLKYLIASTQRHFPDFGKEGLKLAAKGGLELHPRLVAASVVRDLAHLPVGLIIMLDDYHLITEPVIHRFMEELLCQLPIGVHIIIASRTKPPFSLSRLRISGVVQVITKEELQFTGPEIELFFANSKQNLAEQLVKELQEKTAGWPVAMRLLEFSPDSISKIANNTQIQGVFEYLATEVFDQQPSSVQEFLLATSVLDRVEPDFCDLLLKRTNSGKVVESLERQYFLTPLVGQERIYRYHQLFREFLQNRLGDKRKEILRQAAVLARAAGNAESAIECYISAEAYEQTVDIIREVGHQTLNSGNWLTVARWLEALSMEIIATDPKLALYQAAVEVRRGRLVEAKDWINRANALFINDGNKAGLLGSQLLEAQILRRRGHHLASLALLEEISRRELVGQNGQLLMITLEKMLCFLVDGRLNEAKIALSAAIEQIKLGDDKYTLAHLLEGLGHIFYMQGHYHKALQTYKQATELSPDRTLPGYYTQDCISTIYQDWGEFELAFDYAKRNVAIKENLGLTEALPSAYIQLAGLYVDRGEWALAEEQYYRAINLIRDNHGESFYMALNLIFLAQCLSLQDRWVEARLKAAEALAEAQKQSGLALAVCKSIGAAIFAQTGSIDEGKAMLSTAIADLERMQFKKAVCHAYAIQAWLHFYTGETAMQAARKSLKLAAELSFLQIFLTCRNVFQPILKLGLESGIEVTFIQHILVRQGEKSLPLLAALTDHPKPEVRCRVVAPLAEIPCTKAHDMLSCLTDDPDLKVRQIALMVSKRLGLLRGRELPEDTARLLNFSTLGVFQLSLGGAQVEPANWRTIKTRDLLAYLAHRKEPVSKERILEDLWPDSDIDNAAVIFHTTLYNLRSLLKKFGYQDSILYGSRRYQLKLGSFTSDRQEFQDLVKAGLRVDVAPESAAKLLEQAVALYRGDYLEDMDYSWLLPQQENLKRLYISARLQLSRYYLSVQEYASAAYHLQKVEEYDPFSEEVHTLLMTVYARQGNRLSVKRQYQRLKDVLKTELGLAPSLEMNQLYYSLIR